MKIHIASDHAGFELKGKLKEFLITLGYEVSDHGALALEPNDDYPDFIKPCAEAVANEKDSMGIIIGGSGQGEAMCANRVAGVRASVYYGCVMTKKPIDITGKFAADNYATVHLAREHNNANILSIGERFVTEDEAKEAVKIFLETPFLDDGRHARRINKF